ncbi:MAG: flagellar hook-length control protein FliK [Lachnospiraceae bacterium]|nr:flagellar hook-length control protein FliK [Lachnospiraceae bacterium]
MNISDIYNQITQQMNQQLLKTANGGKMPDTASTTVNSKGMETLLGLNEGEIFEGTVTKLEGGKVTIGLANGNSIQARVEEGVALTKGAATFFQVKSNVDGQVALKAVSQDSFSNPTLLKALNSASLPVTDRNLSLVSEMMKKQLPIDANSLGRMARLAYNFPKVSVETLTQLEKMKLPVTPENIEQLEHYKQGEGKVQTNLESLMKSLPQMVSESGGKEALELNRQLLKVFEPEVQGQDTKPVSDGGTEKGQVTENFTLNAKETVEEAGMQEKEIAAQSDTGKSTEVVSDKQSIPEKVMETADGNDAIKNEQVVAKDTSVTPQNGQISAEAEMVKPAEADMIKAQDEPLKEADRGMNPEELSSRPEQLLKTVEKQDGSAYDQLKNLTQLLEKQDFSPKELKQLFSSDNYRNLLERVMEEQWFLKPEEMENKEKLKQLYQRMDRQMEKLSTLMENAGKAESPMSRQIADTRGNLSFMNDVHQMYNYVQIPLKMANQNATGDLYVYTNKKALRRDKEDISAHLHLEMEHLGTTDVFVRLRGKNLSTNFMLADVEALDLVISHVDILTRRLSNKGFDVDVQVKEKDENTTTKDFVEELLGQEAPKEAVSRYSFDVKV